MAEGTEGTGQATGQALGALETASTPAPEVVTEGQPAEVTEPQGQAAAPATTEEETFFDPASIKGKPELEAAYKQMQAAFTKKTQSMAEVKKAAEAYQNFMADPHNNIRQLAEKLGYQINPVTGQAEEKTGEPQTWDEVYSQATMRAKQEILKDLAPFIGSLKDMKRSTIERQLDESCPDWRVYEDSMQSNLQKHPTLVNDPVLLYQMSVPKEVLEKRATQQALDKLKKKVENPNPAGISTTKQTTQPPGDGKMSFREAVAYAQQNLAEKGIKPPPGFSF